MAQHLYVAGIITVVGPDYFDHSHALVKVPLATLIIICVVTMAQHKIIFSCLQKDQWWEEGGQGEESLGGSGHQHPANWGRRWEQGRCNALRLEAKDTLLLMVHWEELGPLVSTYCRGRWDMWSLARELLPRNTATPWEAKGGHWPCLLQCTQHLMRERGQVIPGRNDSACDKRGTRTKSIQNIR